MVVALFASKETVSQAIVAVARISTPLSIGFEFFKTKIIDAKNQPAEIISNPSIATLASCA